MKVCDICKKPSLYTTTAPTNQNGGVKQVDLCGRCYELFYKKQNQHKFLAYQETVEEVTGESTRETWLQRLKRLG